MASNPFSKATKKRAKLRFALMGTSGSGKTYTALSIAAALGKVAVIDTERGSASKYASLFDFDVLELTNYHPKHYIDAIKAAADAGYDVVMIDSLSHAWNGTGGALEIVDRVTKQSQSKNSYMAWGDVTPLQNQLIEAMIGAPIHVIATMRSKTEYVLDKDERGKSTPRKVGLAPIQREGMEYESDVVGEMDMSNTLIITKTRVPELANAVIPQPGKALGETLVRWLQDGAQMHWAKDGGGTRFNAHMKTLREAGATHLTPEYVLTFLEEDRALERLSDTQLSESEAMTRMEHLAENEDKPTREQVS